jgi:hypothetical protein
LIWRNVSPWGDQGSRRRFDDLASTAEAEEAAVMGDRHHPEIEIRRIASIDRDLRLATRSL